MPESRFGLGTPAMGPGPVAELINSWEGQAAESLQTEYPLPPTFEAHFADNYPRSARKVESSKKLPGWARRRHTRAQDGYLDTVAKVNRSNEAKYAEWQDTVAEICIEVGGVALMTGNEDLADELLSSERVPQGQAGRSDKFGMAMLASGHPDEAKHILLRGSSESFPFTHAQNLLDAYRASDDPDYRTSLIHSYGVEPYLLARLARHDLTKGRSAEDLFEAAEGNWGARIAVAAVLASSPDETTALRFGGYLDKQVTDLKPPEKQWKTQAEIEADAFREDGIFATIDLAFDAFEAGLDAVFGEGSSSSEPVHTEEYDRWWKKNSLLLAEVWPNLVGRQDFDKYLGRFSQDVAKKANTFGTQLERAEWGDPRAAAIALDFRNKGKAHTRMLAYRHLLRDRGPAGAMGYINRVPSEHRRSATYYTLVSFALNGAELHTPKLPDMTDTHGPLLALHRRIREAASDSTESADEATLELAWTEAEVNVTNLDTVSQVELASLLAKIQAIPDLAERERQLRKLLGENN